MSTEIELVVDAKAVIGESPLWRRDQGALYWIDVKAAALYCTDIATLETTSWHLPSDIGGYALKSDGAGAFLGLRTGIFSLDFVTGELSKLCDAPFSRARGRGRSRSPYLRPLKLVVL
jgi:sugar lactone lactonase YvrE